MHPGTQAIEEFSVSLLLLNPDDNVVTATRELQKGETVQLNGRSISLPQRLPIGHKAAARDIAAGEKIFKYGVPIGSAIVAIAAGEHVHTHNIQSDYIPTFTLDGQRTFLSHHA